MLPVTCIAVTSLVTYCIGVWQVVPRTTQKATHTLEGGIPKPSARTVKQMGGAVTWEAGLLETREIGAWLLPFWEPSLVPEKMIANSRGPVAC